MPQYPAQHPPHLPQHPSQHLQHNYPSSQIFNSNHKEGQLIRHPNQPLHPNYTNRQAGRYTPRSPAVKHNPSIRHDISHTLSQHPISSTHTISDKADQHSNGGLTTIPFEGEQASAKKKKSPKKKKTPGSTQSPAKLASTERSKSMPSSLAHLDHESRIYIQEREQALLQSQETIQILQSKISRLEHLLQLKDLRIEDLDMKLKSA